MTVYFSRSDRFNAMQRAGTDITVEILTYPLSPDKQIELVGLLRTEWNNADYNWIEAMQGDYSEHLIIASVLVRQGGIAVATSTIHFARHGAETAVIGSVLTHPVHRGRGLAGRAIDAALALAEGAGCKVCLLGTTTRPRNVYLNHGFQWHNGVVMRRDFGTGGFEQDYFAGRQPTAIRATHWGDLPGFSLLLAQPLATACLDYPRGLMSGRYSPADRCLSSFPVLWYDTVARRGLFAVLAAPGNGRVFGFGSVTPAPGPARRHTVTLDFATHENFDPHLPALLAHLIEGCRELGARQAYAFVAEGDTAKSSCLHARGFRETARLPSALQFTPGSRDVAVLHATF